MNCPNERRNPPTVSLVLETNNLRGTGSGAAADAVVTSLERLLMHLNEQTIRLSQLMEVVVTHDGLSEAHKRRLERAAETSLVFALLPEGTGYYEAKNLGFDRTTAEVVAFADADCWPDSDWLERLVEPFFEKSGADVAAGRTTYRDDVLGVAATAIDFMYFQPDRATTRNFYANNVAFRREVFASYRYLPAPGIYRGHCQQLGLRLAADRVPIRYIHAAHTVHRFPDSKRELLRLRILRGADTVEMAPHFAAALLPPRMRWLGGLGAPSALAVLGVRLGFSARAVNRQGMTRARGAKRAACVAGVVALSAADAVGALARSVVRADLGVYDGGFRRGALRYHGNADGLG